MNNSYEEYLRMVQSFNELWNNYQETRKLLIPEIEFNMFTKGWLNQCNYKGYNYYRCNDGQILVSNLN
jgi:hypothetical protein